MARPKKTDTEKEEPVNDAAKNVAKLLIKGSKHVYNDYPTVYYQVSTGSLALDIATGGGIIPGVSRLVGASMGGKTHEAFQVMQNTFEVRERSRGVYIKTERLSKKTEKRIGVKIVTDAEEWDNHTCLMLECNVYDVVSQFIIDLIMGNIDLPEEEQEQFVFIIDSLDFLILESDLAKKANEAFKVSGPQVITKKLMQRVLLPLGKFGHLGIFISQVTSQPKIDPYAPVEHRATNGSGGNAIVHAADNILEYGHRNGGDYIYEKPDDKKSKILGHLAKVTFKKSDDEKYNQKVTYPIRYNQTGGRSVWLEREVADYSLAYGFFGKRGAWITPAEGWLEKLREVDPEFPEQVQGMNNLYSLFDEKPDIVKFLFKELKEILTVESVSSDALLDEVEG